MFMSSSNAQLTAELEKPRPIVVGVTITFAKPIQKKKKSKEFQPRLISIDHQSGGSGLMNLL
jgi:hypothetical protein